MKYNCPHCQVGIPDVDSTIRNQYLGFDYKPGISSPYNTKAKDLEVVMMLCPACENKSYWIQGLSDPYNNVKTQIFPKSKAKKFPNYIPQQLLEDYEEAYSILELSPKASATLSRRCLQGIIRDFQDVKAGSLYNEIKQLETVIPSPQYKVLHSLRKIGNIGAHLEKDVNLLVEINREEAEKLINLIEYLFEKWYIEQKETENLFDSINHISDEKKNPQKGKSDK